MSGKCQPRDMFQEIADNCSTAGEESDETEMLTCQRASGRMTFKS